MRVEAKDFMHPDDRAALEALRSIPLFPQALKTFMKLMDERQVYILNMAQKIRLGPDQLPEIYGLLPPICADLGIPEPELFLTMSPEPNAWTHGDTHVHVTLTSALLEDLEPEEVRAVLAHECGHIACHHVLYRTMADWMVRSGGALIDRYVPLPIPISEPLRMGLLYWVRRSELSADRAAALVMRAVLPVATVMIRLAGGPKRVTGHVNLDSYVRQADAYDHLSEAAWTGLLQNLAEMHSDHPFAAIRAREILRWGQTDAYRALLRVLDTPACPACGTPVDPAWKFCRRCGHALARPAAAVREETPS